MYNKEKMISLFAERDTLDVYDEVRLDEIWQEVAGMFVTGEDLDALADYMLDGMTYDEFGAFEEIVDDINIDIATQKFIDALEQAIEKYPIIFPPGCGFTEEQQIRIEKKRFARYMLGCFKESLAEREANK